jgi:hypothetical protein
MNDRVSVAGSHVPVVFLSEQDRLRIRLGAVSVDSIPGGGGRALFELFATGNEAGNGPHHHRGSARVPRRGCGRDPRARP